MSGVRHSTEISLQREASDSEDDANQTVYGIFAGEQSDETDVKSDNLEEFLDHIGTFRAYLTHLQRKRDMLALPAPEDILQITHGETQSKDNVDFPGEPETRDSFPEEGEENSERNEVQSFRKEIEKLRRENADLKKGNKSN